MKLLRQFYLLFLFLLPIGLMAQYPNRKKDKINKTPLIFKPGKQLPRKAKTWFTGIYTGTLDGQIMELSFKEKIYNKQLYLILTLKNKAKKKTYRGVTKVNSKSYLLENVTLLDERGNLEIIKSLYLHNNNRNFINLISGRGRAGCFAKNGEAYDSFHPGIPFKNSKNFGGTYWGRIDGRPAELSIQKKGNGYLISIDDEEQKIQYWTFVNKLPIGKNVFTLANISLKSTTNSRKLLIDELVLDLKMSKIISGSFYQKRQKVGLFFLREPLQIKNNTLLPIFPWPPPEATDIMKFPDDLMAESRTLGDVNRLISSSLNQSGYRFKPNKYFKTPNGFALVTQLEKVDCDAFPKAGDERWNVEVTPSKKDFNLLDYLWSLVSKKESLYRIFAFIITDDLNPGSSASESFENTSGWLLAGSEKLPEAIAKTPLNNNHYCHVYVYEFSKEDGQVQAEMIKKGNPTCWRSGETHLRNARILDNLVARP